MTWIPSRVATVESTFLNRRYATGDSSGAHPALQGRAKINCRYATLGRIQKMTEKHYELLGLGILQT
jgi:hypothetical protein